MATWEDVRAAVAALPGTAEPEPRRWRARDKGLAWERPLRPGDLAALGDAAPDGPILAVRVADVEAAESMVADDPAVFFRTPHFSGYPAVLVRLDVIEPDELHGLLVEAWLARVPKRTARAYREANP
jgi:hypothetical protein